MVKVSKVVCNLPECKHCQHFEVGHVPAVNSVGRQTNQSPDEIHVTGLQNVNNVLPHKVSILLTKTLRKVGGEVSEENNRR